MTFNKYQIVASIEENPTSSRSSVWQNSYIRSTFNFKENRVGIQSNNKSKARVQGPRVFFGFFFLQVLTVDFNCILPSLNFIMESQLESWN